MTTQTTTDAGATLHLGGDAYCSPDLAPLLVDVDTVSLYPGNARRHDQDAITASIRELGCWRAQVAQTATGHILVGNGQHTALVELGATQVPVTWRDCTDDLARVIVVRDNRVGDLATDDTAALLRTADAMPDRRRLSEGAVYTSALRRWTMLTDTDWKGAQHSAADTTWAESDHRPRLTDTGWACSCGDHGTSTDPATAHALHRTRAYA